MVLLPWTGKGTWTVGRIQYKLDSTLPEALFLASVFTVQSQHKIILQMPTRNTLSANIAPSWYLIAFSGEIHTKNIIYLLFFSFLECFIFLNLVQCPHKDDKLRM